MFVVCCVCRYRRKEVEIGGEKFILVAWKTKEWVNMVTAFNITSHLPTMMRDYYIGQQEKDGRAPKRKQRESREKAL